MKHKSKLILILITIFILFSTNLVFATSATNDNGYWERYYREQMDRLTSESNDKVQESRKAESKPNIKLISSSTFSVNAGESKKIELEIQNITPYTAQNIFVQASLASSDDLPFTIEFLNSSNNISALGASGKATVELLIKADSLAESKRYDINLEYSYNNSYKESFTGKDLVSVKVENTAITPKVSISDFNLNVETIEPEGTAELTAILRNTGKQVASDVQLVVDGLSTDTLSVTNNANSLFYDKLEPESENQIIFNITAAKKIKEGNYPLTFKITYKDNNEKELTYEQKFFVKVSGISEEQKPFLQIQNLSVPSETYPVGQDFTLHLDIVNNGKTEAKNVKVSTEYGTEGAVVPKSTSIQMVNTLEAGASVGFDFKFAATSTAKSQNYPISFKLEYEDGTTDESGAAKIISYTQYTGVNISNPDSETTEEDSNRKSVPKIIISKYSCDPIMVNAGQEFDLNMTFTNTHANKKVSNIKIFFTMPETDTNKTGNVFIPVDSSNTFYIDSIAPKGSVEKNVRLFSMPDADAKTYNLTVNFDYEDETGTLPAATEIIGINVKQPSKLELSDVSLPDSGNVGEPISIGFSLYNTGKVKLTNLRVRIVGDFDTQESDTYFGNCESGDSNYYEGIIIPNAAGKQSGQLIISYDEPNGERKEDIKQIDLTVADNEPMDTFQDGMMIGPDGMPIDPNAMGNQKKGIMDYIKSPILWAVVAVIIVVIAVVVIIIKRRKKQKGFDLDD